MNLEKDHCRCRSRPDDNRARKHRLRWQPRNRGVPDHENRNQRSVLVTAGISGQVPIMLSGHYGQLNQLIDQAWREFSQNKQELIGVNDSKGTTIASVSVKPTKKPDQKNPNKESILSLF